MLNRSHMRTREDGKIRSTADLRPPYNAPDIRLRNQNLVNRLNLIFTMSYQFSLSRIVEQWSNIYAFHRNLPSILVLLIDH